MLLLIQPCLNGYFDQQQHRLQRAITEVVDEVAVEEGFVRSAPEENPSDPARPPRV